MADRTAEDDAQASASDDDDQAAAERDESDDAGDESATDAETAEDTGANAAAQRDESDTAGVDKSDTAGVDEYDESDDGYHDWPDAEPAGRGRRRRDLAVIGAGFGVLALFVVVVLAATGSNVETKAPPAPVETTRDRSDGFAPGAPIDVCELVDQPALEFLLGSELRPGIGSAAGTTPNCEFAAASEGLGTGVQITVSTDLAGEARQSTLPFGTRDTFSALFGAPTSVSGVGESALYAYSREVEPQAAMLARRGNTGVQVVLKGFELTSAQGREQATLVVKQALENL